MIEPSSLVAFVVASIAVVLTPSLAQALVLTRTLSDGKQAGIFTAIGLNVETLVHACAAALGLSATLATSALAFALVKYLGAAYFGYLGVQALRTKTRHVAIERLPISTSTQRFAQAVATGILNPKAALFFLAFLPQFVDPQPGSAVVQCMILGGLLALIDIVYETMLTLLAETFRAWLTSSKRVAVWRQRVTGTTLIGLGIRLAFTEHA